MGKKPRSKGVDVTKALLQSASVSDYIAVQVAPSNVITVSDDELSPTQGSEAAFALRRDGKLDSVMKLCLNWRAGACHNYAACTFAHVVQYYSVDNPGAHPPTSGAGEDGAVTRSAAASGAAGPSSPGDGRNPWLSKVAAGSRTGSPALPLSGSGWGARTAGTSSSGPGYVDLAEAMASKAAPAPHRLARTSAAAQAPSSSPTAATRRTPEAEPASFLPLGTTSAPATPAPAVQDLLLRQITGSGTGATGPATSSAAAGLTTPRQQGVPLPRSGVFSASPFSTSPYAVSQPPPTGLTASSSTWAAPLVTGTGRAAGALPALHIAPTLGHPSPAIRHLMTLLTADD